MSIKSEMVNENEEELEFPCLMKAINGDVIIATSEHDNYLTGTLVRQPYRIFLGPYRIFLGLGDPSLPLGYYSDKWFKDCFKPLKDGEKITLQNNFE